MKRLVAAAGLLLLTACSTAKYQMNPDGSRPFLYPEARVKSWQIVDGAYQSSSDNVRIYIDPTAEFDKDVQLGNCVRIGAHAYIDEDVMLFPNVTVGDDSRVGGDAIVQSGVKIGKKVTIRGDSKIGADSVIGDGATIGKWAIIGQRVSIGAGARIGVGATLDNDAIVAASRVVSAQEHVTAAK